MDVGKTGFILERQRPELDGVYEAEDSSVCTNAQRQRRHDHRCRNRHLKKMRIA
jgi:hypothetical protein